MNDRDVIFIGQYIERNFPKPTCDPCDSYSRWAANEILERTILETEKLPSYITGVESIDLLDIVEEFIDEMDYYAAKSSYEASRLAFSVAREEAKCILHEIKTKGEIPWVN